MVNFIQQVARVWVRENMVSSRGEVAERGLEDLDRYDEVGLFGGRAAVDGPKAEAGIICEVFQPGKKVTTNCFDKAQLYHNLTSIQKYLDGLGIKIYRSVDDPSSGKTMNAFPVRAHANATSDLNAWYSPQDMDLTFGTSGAMSKGKDKWHLASDNDVSSHEFGHLALDVINPVIGSGWSGEGGAIHEGFADALAAMYFNDAEMSEDFLVAMGGEPNEGAGLRTVDNNLKLSKVSTESHDRGRVYSGFLWSIRKELLRQDGPFNLAEKDASDMVLKILFNHAYMYTVSTPSSQDFVNAIVAGIDALAAAGRLGVDAQALKEVVLTEAGYRELSKAVVVPGDNGECVENFDKAKELAGPRSVFGSARVQKYIGGATDVRQQYYRTDKGYMAKVIGGIAVARTSVDGVKVYTSGLRPITGGQIDETVNISLAKAYEMMGVDAGKKLQQANSGYFTATQMTYKTKAEYIQAVKTAQMDYRIAERAIQRLQTRSFTGGPRPELAIIPGSNNLHYEVKVGLGIYYVNAATGDVIFKKDVFI